MPTSDRNPPPAPLPLPPPWAYPPPLLPLTSTHLHLYLAPTSPPPYLQENLLSPDEITQFNRLLIPEKRHQALASRLLLRQVLSTFLNVKPQDLIFSHNPHGKPYLQDFPLHFNLSHTAGFALLAVTRDLDVGIDIESINRDTSMNYEQLAQRFFTPEESAALLSLPLSDRRHSFYRCWTRKEALLKASGLGLSAGLNTFSVPLHASTTPIPINTYHLHDLPVPPTHIASLATQSANPILHFWHHDTLNATSTQ